MTLLSGAAIIAEHKLRRVDALRALPTPLEGFAGDAPSKTDTVFSASVCDSVQVRSWAHPLFILTEELHHDFIAAT